MRANGVIVGVGLIAGTSGCPARTISSPHERHAAHRGLTGAPHAEHFVETPLETSRKLLSFHASFAIDPWKLSKR